MLRVQENRRIVINNKTSLIFQENILFKNGSKIRLQLNCSSIGSIRKYRLGAVLFLILSVCVEKGLIT